MRKILLWTLLIMAIAYGGTRMYISKRMKGPRWDRLTPGTKQKTLDLLAQAENEGLNVMFWDGWRDTEEQTKNIQAGTSFVKNPLNSKHPWGIAVDIVFVDALGMPSWPDPKVPANLEQWKKLGELGERVGFSWGGRWKAFDGPHFQEPGINTADLRTQYGDQPLAYLREQGVMV
jgi:hypothetical protein